MTVAYLIVGLLTAVAAGGVLRLEQRRLMALPSRSLMAGLLVAAALSSLLDVMAIVTGRAIVTAPVLLCGLIVLALVLVNGLIVDRLPEPPDAGTTKPGRK